MCGICGFFGKKKNKREIVEKMKEKLVHRGPDAQGSFVNDSVALGFRRLSIIDLEGGLQPMKSSSQNLTVVFNGEIYNYLTRNCGSRWNGKRRFFLSPARTRRRW